MDNIDHTELENAISTRLTKMQLSELRKSKHLTQKEVAESAGISVQSVFSIENESGGNPTLKSLIKYLDCLGYEIAFQPKTI